MNRELIRGSLSGRGPFIIRTSDGREFRAPHSEFVFVGRHNLVVEHPNGFVDIIDPLHIVSIRPAIRQKQRKNGH